MAKKSENSPKETDDQAEQADSDESSQPIGESSTEDDDDDDDDGDDDDEDDDDDGEDDDDDGDDDDGEDDDGEDDDDDDGEDDDDDDDDDDGEDDDDEDDDDDDDDDEDDDEDDDDDDDDGEDDDEDDDAGKATKDKPAKDKKSDSTKKPAAKARTKAAAGKPKKRPAGGRAPKAAAARKKPTKRGSPARNIVLFILVVGGLAALFGVLGSQTDGGNRPPPTPKWKVGDTVDVDITLVAPDYKNLTCAMAGEIAGFHCANESKSKRHPKAAGQGADSRKNDKLLQPYTLTNRIQLLAAGVWAQPALKKKLSGRFTATCKLTISGKVEKAQAQWKPGEGWFGANGWFVGSVKDCKIKPRKLPKKIKGIKKKK